MMRFHADMSSQFAVRNRRFGPHDRGWLRPAAWTALVTALLRALGVWAA
jgi:hypothetical protein